MNFHTPFYKKQTKSDVVSVPVPDLKQYLVQEFEKARDRELIEDARIVEQKYGAVLVTLEEYQSLQSRNDSLVDQVNSLNILLSRAGQTKEEMKDNITQDVIADLIKAVESNKGNLSKQKIIDLISGYQNKNKYF